jgi:hypothetical protein
MPRARLPSPRRLLFSDASPVRIRILGCGGCAGRTKSNKAHVIVARGEYKAEQGFEHWRALAAM